jgi:hypothetical protein
VPPVTCEAAASSRAVTPGRSPIRRSTASRLAPGAARLRAGAAPPAAARLAPPGAARLLERAAAPAGLREELDGRAERGDDGALSPRPATAPSPARRQRLAHAAPPLGARAHAQQPGLPPSVHESPSGYGRAARSLQPSNSRSGCAAYPRGHPHRRRQPASRRTDVTGHRNAAHAGAQRTAGIRTTAANECCESRIAALPRRSRSSAPGRRKMA